MDFTATLSAARALNIDDRILLVETLWDDIADNNAVPDLTDEQKQEIDRRLAAHEADPSNVIPWEQVKSEARSRSRR